MTGSADPAQVRPLLERDRLWAAYALADLEPTEAAFSSWWSKGEAVVLVYRGITPPVLFALGSVQTCLSLIDLVPPARYIFTLPTNVRTALDRHLQAEHETPMWRMALSPGEYAPVDLSGTHRLDAAHRAEIEEFFGDHPDRPDAFHPRQLEKGSFYGIRHESRLVSVAGTHIVAPTVGVGAIGNVFTAPPFRNQGFGRRATGAVVEDLRQRGLETIVLNVAQANAAAVQCYHRLGFRPHCGYAEGVGYLRGEI